MSRKSSNQVIDEILDDLDEQRTLGDVHGVDSLIELEERTILVEISDRARIKSRKFLKEARV
jgi:hypothetical protein